MSSLLVYLINGLNTSALLLIAALGLMVILGLMKVINLAHGELIMIGAYMSYFTSTVLGQNFFLGMTVSFISTAFLGIIIEKFIIKKLYKRPMETLLATFGLSIILQQVITITFGPELKYIAVPFDGYLKLGNIIIPLYNIFAIAMALSLILFAWILFFKTSFGKKVRAITQNRDICECLGIDTMKIDSYTFAFGSGLAGLAGAILSPIRSVSPFMGSSYLTDSFMTVVLGGTGSIFGISAASAIVGESIAVLGGLSNEIMAKILVFLMVIVVIRFRPQGLFSKERR